MKKSHAAPKEARLRPMVGDTVSGLLALIFLGTLLAPTIAHWMGGLTLTATLEESFGYRYVGSLRILYGDEHPFVPQGHLPGILHVGIQGFLTAIGRSLDELFPRIDWFGYLAVFIPLGFGSVGLFATLRQFHHAREQLLVTTLALSVVVAPPLESVWFMMPDYHPWAIGIAFGSLAIFMRLFGSLHQQVRLTPLCAIGLGVLVGLSMLVKISYALFWIPHLVLLWARLRFRPAFGGTALIGGAAIVTWSLGILAYYGSLMASRKFLEGLQYFIATQHRTLSLDQGMSVVQALFLAIPMPFGSLSLLPAFAMGVLAASFTQRFYRTAALAFAAAVLAAFIVATQRPYWATFIESQLMAVAAMVGLFWISRRSMGTEATRGLRWSILASILVLSAISLSFIPSVVDIHVGRLRISATYQKANMLLEDEIGKAGGKIALLSADNTYRITSIRGGICKGGSEIFAPQEGLSPFTRSLFPEMWCGAVPRKLDVNEFALLVFLQLETETFESALSRISRAFSIPTNALRCDKAIPTANATLRVCRPGT